VLLWKIATTIIFNYHFNFGLASIWYRIKLLYRSKYIDSPEKTKRSHELKVSRTAFVSVIVILFFYYIIVLNFKTRKPITLSIWQIII
jgi:hypothetical protein